MKAVNCIHWNQIYPFLSNTSPCPVLTPSLRKAFEWPCQISRLSSTFKSTFLQLTAPHRAGSRVRLRSPSFSTLTSPFLSRYFKKVLLFVLSQRQTSEHDQRFLFTPQPPPHVPPFLSRLLARHPHIQSRRASCTPVLLLKMVAVGRLCAPCVTDLQATQGRSCGTSWPWGVAWME
jgi:hypothetical protein